MRNALLAALASIVLGGVAGCAPGLSGGDGSGGASPTGGRIGGNVGGGNGNGSGGVGTGSGTGGAAVGTGSGGVGTVGTGGRPSGTGGTTTTGTGGTTTTGTGGRGAGTGGGNATGGAPAIGGAGGGVVWPNDMSKANSDTWLSQNHDRITQLQPRVLVIDLENTANAQTLIDRHIAALKEASSPHKFKDPTAQPAVAFQLLKIVQAPKGGSINYASWNTQAFADSNLQIKDPADPAGPNLTLCGLFEKGIIHEVWCMASSDPKCGETQESKQAYDANGVKVAGRFVDASNGTSIVNLGCKVTARITDFNSGRGVGCHQHAMGHAWERYMAAAGAVPILGKQAKRFLNFDLDVRFQAPFPSFYGACNSNSTQLTNCIVWSSPINATSGTTALRTFNIADMSGGCGNAHFYPNTTGTYSYDANTPDPMVLSSCENYGLHNGTGGKDLTTPFTNAMTDTLFRNVVDDDCGGHGTMYLYQNFPGPGTLATNDDGTPMHNWWVYLFY